MFSLKAFLSNEKPAVERVHSSSINKYVAMTEEDHLRSLGRNARLVRKNSRTYEVRVA